MQVVKRAYFYPLDSSPAIITHGTDGKKARKFIYFLTKKKRLCRQKWPIALRSLVIRRNLVNQFWKFSGIRSFE